MADPAESPGGEEPPHRGRIQAQGGGTEKSESWAQPKPPTESEMLAKCNQLESRLTKGEREDREEALAKLRQFIRNAATAGGISAPVSKSFKKRGSRDIRIDIEVIKGTACVPDTDTN